MPVTFHYVGSETPPAPYVLVTVARPDGASATADVPAKVDTGADRTVIPTVLAERLQLDEVERREFEGLGGYRVSLALLDVLITVRGCPPVWVTAAGSAGEPYILLGRDVLNRYKIVLDGPNQRLVVG